MKKSWHSSRRVNGWHIPLPTSRSVDGDIRWGEGMGGGGVFDVMTDVDTPADGLSNPTSPLPYPHSFTCTVL